MSGVSVRARPRLPPSWAVAPPVDGAVPASDGRPTLYSRSDGSDRHPRPQELRPPRDRGPGRTASTAPSATPSAACPAARGSPASGPARPRGPSSSASSARRAVLDEAVEHLVQDAYREAIVEQDIVPLTNADVEVVEAEEGKPLRFKATVQVRPEVELGDYASFKFAPEIETDRRRQGRQGRRRAARPERHARRGRGPRRRRTATGR